MESIDLLAFVNLLPLHYLRRNWIHRENSWGRSDKCWSWVSPFREHTRGKWTFLFRDHGFPRGSIRLYVYCCRRCVEPSTALDKCLQNTVDGAGLWVDLWLMALKVDRER